MEKVKELPDICLVCGIPRDFYNLRIEPGICNPDFTMGECAEGHVFVCRSNAKNNGGK